jgi:hypothetical protein
VQLLAQLGKLDRDAQQLEGQRPAAPPDLCCRSGTTSNDGDAGNGPIRIHLTSAGEASRVIMLATSLWRGLAHRGNAGSC